MKRLLVIFTIALTVMGCGGNQSVSTYLDVTIDSISNYERYTTIPSNYYHYHTSIGVIPSNQLNYKVGDKITVKTIKYVK